ncbi:lysyl oxidase family protein [Georgenia sp. AZ-5]|uniref:lysyl oxidase family protein n=1 Tax=Georgenia sp. AZ-5 TaxID=3367526 RepID=UPI0037551A01
MAQPDTASSRVATPDGLLPDLLVEPLSDFRVQIVEGRRVVRFSASIGNRGDGPLEVVGTRTSTSTPEMAVVQRIEQPGGGYVSVPTDAVMRYASADGHAHWHVQDAARYTLEAPGEDEPRVAHKEGFCLVDGTALEGTPDGAGEYRSCAEGLPDSRSAREGISVGWSDPYPFDVWGQWIDLTGLALPGRYCVAATADPLGLLAEKDTANNTASALLDLTSNGVTVVGTGC